jgi:Mg2+ and Co2+ transporter CorA
MRFIRFLERLLNDAVMGFLAIVGFGVALAPEVFDLSSEAISYGPRLLSVFSVVEWVVLIAFTVDFAVGFTVAKDRPRWIRSPWRIVDILCIVGGLVSLLPLSPDGVGGSVALRLLRLGRVVAFGTIAGTTVAETDGESGPGAEASSARVRVYGPDGALQPGRSWQEVIEWLPRPTNSWFDVCNAARSEMDMAARSVGLPPDLLRTVLDSRAGGRYVTWPGGSAISFWLPAAISEGFPEIRREQVVIVLPSAGIFTATLSSFELPGTLASSVQPSPFGPPTLRRILEYGASLHGQALSRLDDELRMLEQTGLSGGNTEFLSRVFRLRREMSAAAADLGRFAALVRQLAEPDRGPKPDTGDVVAELDELGGRFGELRENLQSLMDLHLNVKSYQINQFMRFLAVVSFLGLSPSIAGGLLGMNVTGNPWTITLPQVAFIVAMAIAFSLYLFGIRGWLR